MCFLRVSHALSPNTHTPGISQRDVLECFPETVRRHLSLSRLIRDAFDSHIRGKFPLRSYAVDVYVTSKDAVRIVDFNTWGGTTQPLLFSWEELIEAATRVHDSDEDLSDDELMRVVLEPGQIRPGVRASCGVPFDLVDTSEGGAIDDFIRKHKDDFGAM